MEVDNQVVHIFTNTQALGIVSIRSRCSCGVVMDLVGSVICQYCFSGVNYLDYQREQIDDAFPAHSYTFFKRQRGLYFETGAVGIVFYCRLNWNMYVTPVVYICLFPPKHCLTNFDVLSFSLTIVGIAGVLTR
jgi:hypothetical protein